MKRTRKADSAEGVKAFLGSLLETDQSIYIPFYFITQSSGKCPSSFVRC